MTTDELLDRALAGARFLDETARGWRKRIRRSDLDMSEAHYTGPGSCGCILAQLSESGDFYEGVDEFAVRDEYALGFNADSNVEFAGLTNAWKRVLREGLR